MSEYPPPVGVVYPFDGGNGSGCRSPPLTLSPLSNQLYWLKKSNTPYQPTNQKLRKYEVIHYVQENQGKG